VVSEQ
jgi:hypothetical protein